MEEAEKWLINTILDTERIEDNNIDLEFSGERLQSVTYYKQGKRLFKYISETQFIYYNFQIKKELMKRFQLNKSIVHLFIEEVYIRKFGKKVIRAFSW